MKRLRAWLDDQIKVAAHAHNIGLFRDAFAQRGYPIDAWADIDIDAAVPAMYAAIAEANLRRLGYLTEEKTSDET